jgi:hypothetical protein
VKVKAGPSQQLFSWSQKGFGMFFIFCGFEVFRELERTKFSKTLGFKKPGFNWFLGSGKKISMQKSLLHSLATRASDGPFNGCLGPKQSAQGPARF